MSGSRGSSTQRRSSATSTRSIPCPITFTPVRELLIDYRSLSYNATLASHRLLVPNSATFLHLTDAHLAAAGAPFERDDHKINIPGIEQETRESAMELTLSRLAERLERSGRRLDGVLFSGDAQDRGRPGGHQILLDLILRHFGPLGVATAQIVAVPGNHDVQHAEFKCQVPGLYGGLAKGEMRHAMA
ncbi:MAG: hypothetical protein E5W53_07165 [Mesorhizobium sp.]|nr:MAG: hypothetical protein E5W53_07165 [Mesorhizobium sp.]